MVHRSTVAKTEENSRYFLGHLDKTMNHALIAEGEDGKVKIIDAQSGNEYNEIEEITNIITSNVEYWRIDDLEVTQTAYNACKKR